MPDILSGAGGHSEIQWNPQHSRWNSSSLVYPPSESERGYGDTVSRGLPQMLRVSSADLNQSLTTHQRVAAQTWRTVHCTAQRVYF